jgi:hypothetical protein
MAMRPRQPACVWTGGSCRCGRSEHGPAATKGRRAGAVYRVPCRPCADLAEQARRQAQEARPSSAPTTPTPSPAAEAGGYPYAAEGTPRFAMGVPVYVRGEPYAFLADVVRGREDRVQFLQRVRGGPLPRVRHDAAGEHPVQEGSAAGPVSPLRHTGAGARSSPEPARRG